MKSMQTQQFRSRARAGAKALSPQVPAAPAPRVKTGPPGGGDCGRPGVLVLGGLL